MSDWILKYHLYAAYVTQILNIKTEKLKVKDGEIYTV